MTEIPPIEELLLNFESLGDNCEFGLLQRQAGIEPLGLLRFTFTPMEALLRGLACGFKDLADPDNILITVAGNTELMVRIAGYDFTYHTGRHEHEITFEALRKDEKTKLGFLARRLIGTLKSGEKILVRKGRNTQTLAEAKSLLAAMHQYGKATLLWVVEADAGHPAGSVELLEPHLICGRIDHFAPYDEAQSLNYTNWIDICRGAFALWSAPFGQGSVLHAAPRDQQATNLLYRDAPEPQELQARRFILQKAGVSIQTAAPQFPARVPGRHTVCQHKFSAADKGMLGIKISMLQPDQPYTFSMWIRFREGPKVEAARLFIPNSKYIRSRRANIRQLDTWQRLEVSAIAAEDGIMFPRLIVKAEDGAMFETANWRFEPGRLVDADEMPGDAESPAPEAKLLAWA